MKKLDFLRSLLYKENMKITKSVSEAIQKIPNGYVFTYADVMTAANQKEAVIKALNRMAAAGKIVKLAKGKFYKPEESAFGKLQLLQGEIVKDLLEKDGKVIGYLTGYSIYNKLGFTTQVSYSIQVGKNEVRPSFKRQGYTISFIKQKNIITEENIPLLQILDAARTLKKIPDTTLESACKRLLVLICALNLQDKSELARLALKYPTAVRALVGAILEETGDLSLTGPLRKSLNPISVYKLSGIDQIVPAAKTWNIK